jgi:hypothetical protein
MAQPVHAGSLVRQYVRGLKLLYIQSVLTRFGWTTSQFRMAFPEGGDSNPVERYCNALIGRSQALNPIEYTEYLVAMRRRAFDFLIVHPPVNLEDALPDMILNELISLFDSGPRGPASTVSQPAFTFNPAPATS